MKCKGLAVLCGVILVGNSCSLGQSALPRESQVHEACNISVIVENNKKLGGFVLKQLGVELNRILSTGGANIHVSIVPGGRADYVLRVQDFAPKNNVEGDILGQTAKDNPHYSFLFVEAIENVWRQRGSLPRGGRGIVYARVYAHELAAHGILRWAHSRVEDKDMGFVGSGKYWSDALFNNEDDRKFEFSPAVGRLLNSQCRLAEHEQGLAFAQPTNKPKDSTEQQTLPVTIQTR